MPVDYLLYVSQARAGLTDADLEEILAASRRNNEKRISGILLYAPRRDGSAGSFMQLLEGNAEDLEELRQRIFDDPRHHTKVVIEKGTKEERDFPDWSMAFKNAPAESLAKYPVFKDLGEAHFLDRCQRDTISGGCEFLLDFWKDA
ncbi:BLUF domain-containing protein [Alkalilacustris brevis]|uniref:BLUF domain-containing protein n=1 Tax=Alkalilacustris brevis TaxID=2026338 RepID=UPI0013904DC9|nr:BLUF domain-containing protein [Alkalilacustris brevis]